jgi:phenylalanyl-tRNA synthetase beta chain
MQFPESWLRSLADPAEGTDALAHRLTMAGLEVEDLQPAAPPFSGVVVAQVLETAKHPNADKLTVCQVDAGGERLTIVCGAPNVAPGVKVPCAVVGAKLPGDFEIKLAKMRGVESQGMLCSARELGLPEEEGGLLLLDADAPVGKPFREYYALDDRIFTIKLTPNKADCLSVLGVAREVAALTGAALKPPVIRPITPTLSDRLPVKVSAPDLCGRFSGRVIRGVNAKAPTPGWMRRWLEMSGQRSISALVDISNYVMLELGRPTHVFDLDKIHGGLHVRWGKAGEKLELLNGQTIEVDETVGVIADMKPEGEVIESLAGIMGGEATAVSLDTRNVYVEAAFWWPNAIQGRARRYNFSTDAAHRFERGVDYATTAEHIEYLTALVMQVCGGEAGPIDDQVLGLPQRKPVALRPERCVKVLGVPIGRAQILEIFKRLSLQAEDQGERIVVTPPSYRFDLEIEEDLIEEVARVYGFDNIPALPPRARAKMRVAPETENSLHAVRRAIAARDYQEAMNFAFVEEDWERDFAGNADPIRLLNPIASQLAVMRSTLIGSLVANVRHNLKHKQTRVRMFEVGRIFRRDAQAKDGELAVAGVDQPMHVGGIAYGPAAEEQWGVAERLVDYFDVKGDLEVLLPAGRTRFERAEHPALHPGRAARILVDGKAVGVVGELHPRWLRKYELPQTPVVFEVQAAALLQRPLPSYEEVSRMPVVVRDLALVVDSGVSVQEMLDCMHDARLQQPELAIVGNIKLFDEYRGKGLKDNEKSLAFRIWLQDTRTTLNDEQANACVSTLTVALQSRFGATLRA